MSLAKKLMDISMQRHTLLANNLANVNTPGYQRQDINFKDSLLSAIESGRADQIKNVEPDITTENTKNMRPDGNTVTAQQEMSEMVQNELVYKVAMRALSEKFIRIKSAIK